MILVLGGVGAGKKEYALSLGYRVDDFTSDPYDGKPVLYGLETLVRKDSLSADVLFSAACGKEVVLCAEVGSGVIPLDRGEREYREAVGRLSVRLAKEATAVVRVVAGIPAVIKGEV